MSAPSGASAALIRPNTTADQFGTGAECSLREAVQAAQTNAAFGGCPAGSPDAIAQDSIRLQGGTYALTRSGSDDTNAAGDLDSFASRVEIIGPALGRATIDASAIAATGERAMELGGGLVNLQQLTIRGGRSTLANPDGPNGGGISVSSGDVVGINVTITDNRAEGSGGGVRSMGNTTLLNVTISGNRADGDGGGFDGGGRFQNSTIADNVADADADGVGITDNGGGIHAPFVLGILSTIVAGNRDLTPPPSGGPIAPDCSSSPTSSGNNVIGDTAGCGYSGQASDITDRNARLRALAYNGGSTFTHALLANSPALDHGAACLPFDARGASHALDRPCDIGAYERITCEGVLVNRVGTSFNDRLTGTRRADGFVGMNGKDRLIGRGGADGLCGGNKRDRLLGGRGNDHLDGGPGPDLCRGGPGRNRLRRC